MLQKYIIIVVKNNKVSTERAKKMLPPAVNNYAKNKSRDLNGASRNNFKYPYVVNSCSNTIGDLFFLALTKKQAIR